MESSTENLSDQPHKRQKMRLNNLFQKPFDFMSAVTEVSGVNVLVRHTRGALNTLIAQSPEADLYSAAQSRELAMDIFNSLKDEEEDELRLQHFIELFPSHDEAKKAFKLFDADGSKSVSKEEFLEAFSTFHTEKRSIDTGIKDMGAVVGKLDDLFLVLMSIVLLVVWLSIFGVTLTTYLVTFGSLIVTTFIIIGNSCKTVFENIIFLFVIHPFDTGDKISFDGMTFVVQSMTLSKTIIQALNGQVTSVPNSILQNKIIYNFRRSGMQSENISVYCNIRTTKAELDEFEKHMLSFLRENKKDFQQSISLAVETIKDAVEIALPDSYLKVTVSIKYRSNFQNGVLIQARRNKFMLALRDCLRISGIQEKSAEK